MFHKFLFAFILIILITPILFAQQNMQDVVYLNNGSIIRGIIIEQVPSQYIKIQTQDGSVFVYNIEDIQKITKETATIVSPPKSDTTIPLADRSILINPLGFIQFGPIIQGEFKVAPNTLIGPHIRFSGLGLLYHAIVDYDETSFSSMAVGIGAKQFFGSSQSPHRFYAGGFAEYGWGSGINRETIWNSVSYKYEDAKYDHSYISLLSNFGYRWRFSTVFLNVGLIAGMAAEIEDKMNYPHLEEYSKDIFFLGMAEVSIGFEF
jgi:hypothetical protein